MSLGEIKKILASSGSGPAKGTPEDAMHSEQPLTAGTKAPASSKVYASLSRRTRAVEVDGA